MRRTVAGYGARVSIGLAVAGLVAVAPGCSAGSDAGRHASDAAPALPATSTAPPPPSPASSTVDIGEAAGCFDGDCEIKVSTPVEMPMHPRSRIAVLRIDVVAPDTVRVQATYLGGGYGEATFSGTGAATLNDINVRVLSVEDGRAQVRLSPLSRL